MEETKGSTKMADEDERLFSIYAEKENYDKPLFQFNITFGQLIVAVVLPYDNDDAFFLDGIPVNKKQITRIKILLQKANFLHDFYSLHRNLKRGEKSLQKTIGDQYYTRLEALLRENCEDVTSLVLDAYKTKIKPNKDSIFKNPEIIGTAFKVFLETLAFLNNIKH